MKISIIGAGYVGLVSGACMAECGHDVVCVEKDYEKYKILTNGGIPIYEPGLTELVKKNIKSQNLNFSNSINELPFSPDAIFIAVGTPSDADGKADLSYIFTAVNEIAKSIKKYTVIVTKSTVPIGTNEKIKEILGGSVQEALFDVASNPEFLREGCAIKDFLYGDRVLIGAENEKAMDVLSKIYEPISQNGSIILKTSIVSAEIIKYSSNAFLATKISFINEMSDLCQKVGGNIYDVAHGMGLDKRIGNQFLNAGPGFGGSCFPKDTRALIKISEENNCSSEIVSAVVNFNDLRPKKIVKNIISHSKTYPKNTVFGVLGLTFKANTDDIRESPSLAVIKELITLGYKVVGFDPEGSKNASKEVKELTISHSILEVVQNSNILIIATEWPDFSKSEVWEIMANADNPIYDLRNILNKNDPLFSKTKIYKLGEKW